MTPTLSRDHRNVHNLRLKVGPSAPVHKLTFTIEEALRLCSLPGEDEGRVYYFRNVHITGLPENGDRTAWLDAFQNALVACARNAVDGRLAHAAFANAVYFRKQQEACETLLERIIGRQAIEAWLWGAVSESPSGASAATHVAGVIEKLRRAETGWLAVAAAVFASSDPVALISLIAESTARIWLEELSPNGPPVKPPAIRHEAFQVIARAAKTFHADDSRVLWLASMAVILASPAEMERGTVVNQARTLLETLLPVTMPLSLDANRVADPPPTEELHQPGGDRALALPPGFRPAYPIKDEKPQLRPERAIVHAPADHPDHCFGERTEGAGLYFLLNAMTHLRLPEREPGERFLARLLQRIAKHAGIEPEDSALLWTHLVLEQKDLEAIDESALRLWHRKLRRWCWRNGQIGVRAIVRRAGLVTLTSTDLDVSLPIDSADIRIRRIGLDLDPGWLPWFGRVVRFHYLDRGEFHG